MHFAISDGEIFVRCEAAPEVSLLVMTSGEASLVGGIRHRRRHQEKKRMLDFLALSAFARVERMDKSRTYDPRRQPRCPRLVRQLKFGSESTASRLAQPRLFSTWT
jgi:hypothetical protein